MVRPFFSLHSLFLSVHAGPDASVSAPRRERICSQTRACLGRGTSAHRPAFADKYRGRGEGGCSKFRKIKIGREAIAPLKGRAFKIEISKVSGSALVAEICTDPHNRLLRRQHCSSLCLQSEGHEYVANMTNALGHDFVGSSVLVRHNIRPPSLCEQSELQCFAPGLRQMFARCSLQRCRSRLLFAQKRAEIFLDFEHPILQGVGNGDIFRWFYILFTIT